MTARVRWCGLACVLALTLWGAARADDPERARETFEALFAQDLARVRETGETTDDVALAARLLETARKAAGQPAFLAILCEKACDLALGHPTGYATAAEAMELLAAHVPEKADACRDRLLEVRQKQFDAARGDEKKAAGEAVLDLLLARIDAKEAAGDLADAAGLYRRAQAVARAAESPRRDEVEERADALALRMRTLRRIDDVKTLLSRDPKNVSAREGLVRLHLVDLDDPAAAAKWLEGVEDKDLLKYVPAAARPLEAAPELACLELGEWYRGLAETAPAHAKAAMYARARAYLARFLEVHPTKDLDRTRGEVALEKVKESLAALTAPPPKPAPREKPAKPQPGTIPPGPWVDLLPLVSPERDCHEGTCEQKTGGLWVFSPANGRLTVPVLASGSYQAAFAWKRTWGPGQVILTLPVGSGDVTLILGGYAGAFSGLEKIDGRGAGQNETTIRPSKFDNDRVYRVAVQVTLTGDLAAIVVELDGKPFMSWNGPQSALSANYKVARQGCLGLGLWGAGVLFSEGRLKMLSGTARLLRPAEAAGRPAQAVSPKPAPASPWADLLPHVDPARDAVVGDWSLKEGCLVMTGPGGTRLAIPVAIEGDYQLQVEFAQMRGDNEVAFILPVRSRATALLIGKEVRRRSGLFWAEKGDTMVSPAPLKMREPHVLDVTVRADKGTADIDVQLDGKPYFRWQGPQGSLTVWDAYRLPDSKCVGLGAWGGEVVFKSVRVRMLSGEARLLWPAAK